MKNEIITRLEAHITSECSTIDRESRYDEMLDECYSFEKVGGPFEYLSPAAVLKIMDPVAYRCGLNDWADSESWVEVDGNYYDHQEVEKAKEEFLDELETEISQWDDESANTAEMRKDIETVEKHAF